MSGWMAGLKNLFYWLPVIWKDRWWDHAFLAELVSHKLSQMERQHRLNGHATKEHKERCASRMRQVVEHFKRWGDIDTYHPVEVRDGLWNEAKTSLRMAPTEWQAHKRQMALEQWHWDEAWRKIGKYGQGWWD